MKLSLVMFKADGQRREFHLSKPISVLGRKTSCDLRIPLSSVSRQHCQVEVRGEKAFLRDLGSSNGTFYNNRRVQETQLSAGDRIKIGPVYFTVRIDGEPSGEEIQPMRTVLSDSAVGMASPIVEAGPSVDSLDDSGFDPFSKPMDVDEDVIEEAELYDDEEPEADVASYNSADVGGSEDIEEDDDFADRWGMNADDDEDGEEEDDDFDFDFAGADDEVEVEVEDEVDLDEEADIIVGEDEIHDDAHDSAMGVEIDEIDLDADDDMIEEADDDIHDGVEVEEVVVESVDDDYEDDAEEGVEVEEMVIEEDLEDDDFEAIDEEDESEQDDETLAMDHEFKKQESEADEDSGTFGFGLAESDPENDEIKDVEELDDVEDIDEFIESEVDIDIPSPSAMDLTPVEGEEEEVDLANFTEKEETIPAGFEEETPDFEDLEAVEADEEDEDVEYEYEYVEVDEDEELEDGEEYEYEEVEVEVEEDEEVDDSDDSDIDPMMELEIEQAGEEGDDDEEDDWPDFGGDDDVDDAVDFDFGDDDDDQR